MHNPEEYEEAFSQTPEQEAKDDSLTWLMLKALAAAALLAAGALYTIYNQQL